MTTPGSAGPRWPRWCPVSRARGAAAACTSRRRWIWTTWCRGWKAARARGRWPTHRVIAVMGRPSGPPRGGPGSQNWRRRPMIKRALGIEVYADRGRTALVLAGIPELGSADVELLPLVQGTDAVPAVRALAGRVKLAAIAVDPRSNAATLLEPLRLAGLPVKTPDASDVAVAHGKFSDLTAAGRLRHHRQADLTAAIRFAQSRRLSGSGAIQRYGGTVDPAPAVAAELAVWALGDLDHPDGLQPFALWG